MKLKQTFRLLAIFLFFLSGIHYSFAQQECGKTVAPLKGTLLYKQDFGGNEESDLDISTTPLPAGSSDLPFSQTGGSSGHYGITKYKDYVSFWKNEDHTHWGDNKQGYMMTIDPSAGDMDIVLYKLTIGGLCSETRVTLRAWATDFGGMLIDPPTAPPIFKMMIYDVNDEVSPIAETSDLMPNRSTTQDQWNTDGWCCFDLPITIPSGVSSIKLVILNRTVAGWGNDWALDDIEVRLTTPPVNTTVNNNAITDIVIDDDAQTVQLKSTYIVDNTFGTDLTSYWLYSETGDISSVSDWTPIDQKNATATVGQQWSHDLNLVNVKEGYYRMVISNPANVLSTLCRAASDPIHIHK